MKPFFNRISMFRLLRQFLHYAAVKQVDDAVGVRCIVAAVRHHDNGGAALVEFLQQVHHLLTVHRVKIAGGSSARISGTEVIQKTFLTSRYSCAHAGRSSRNSRVRARASGSMVCNRVLSPFRTAFSMISVILSRLFSLSPVPV